MGLPINFGQQLKAFKSIVEKAFVTKHQFLKIIFNERAYVKG